MTQTPCDIRYISRHKANKRPSTGSACRNRESGTSVPHSQRAEDQGSMHDKIRVVGTDTQDHNIHTRVHMSVHV